MEKMSVSFELISHPDRTLREHLDACNTICKKQLALKFINANRFFNMELIEKMRHLLVYFHDFGKGTDFFQFKIIKATEAEKRNNDFKEKSNSYIADFNRNKATEIANDLYQNERLSNHAKLGAYFVLPHFEHENFILRFILLKVIRRHHGNLTNFFTASSNNNPQILLEQYEIDFLQKQIQKMNFDLYQSILSLQTLVSSPTHWDGILKDVSNSRQIARLQQKLINEKNPAYFFLQHYLFSLLLSADKGDMMLEKDKEERYEVIRANRALPLSIIGEYKKYKHKNDPPRSIDDIREEAYQNIAKKCEENKHQSFFSITLPTGFGKTYCAYNVAVILQNAFKEQYNVTPRIVYVLPFTSIIDQNESILRDILKVILEAEHEYAETWLSKNHYLSYPNDKYDEEQLQKDEGEYLADGWEHDIIVTTFVQMLEGIFTDQNRKLRKFHNMTNTIFILDEVQSIPPRYFEVIELVFKKMNEYFGTKFVFVTATQPYLFQKQTDILELAEPEKYFKGLTRITLDQKLLKTYNYESMELNDFTEILIQDIEENSDLSFLIICNTIRQSQEIYKALSVAFEDITYLSSSILPILRKEIIEKIKTHKGRQIVVSTQVVEAGVDIDLDIVYRDFAPMDSINQSAGRCNRNNMKGSKGIVKLFNLGKQKYIYDKTLLVKTEEILRGYGEQIQEADFYDMNKSYAQKVRKSIAENNDFSMAMKKAIYELNTEDLAKKFELIKDNNRFRNVFIPFCDCAKAIWAEYETILKAEYEDDFERKRAIKKVKPKILQYVTRFPTDKYEKKSDAFIICEKSWEAYYSLKTGFLLETTSQFY